MSPARPVASTLAVLTSTALAVAAFCAFAPAAPAAGSASAACTAVVKQHRATVLRTFQRSMAMRRRAFFGSHPGRRARTRFVRRQRATFVALRRGLARCASPISAADPNVVPENPSEARPAPCTPTLFGAPGAEMTEATFASSLSLEARGRLRAVMLFVDFADRPGSESTAQVYHRLVSPARRWVDEVSYGRASLEVTPVSRWYRMTHGSRGYGLSDGVSFEEQRTFIAEAVRAADQDVDFSPYQIVYVVASRGSALERSPAFHAFAGDGVRADQTELRYGATLGEDVRDVFPHGYGSYVLLHETGHMLGLPDLYDVSNPTYWSLFRFAGGWDMMSWNSPGSHFLAWHKWKLGWLEPSELTCLDAPGDVTATLVPLSRPGGLKAVVVPTGPGTAYVVEARRRTGEDARLCEDGVLVYSVTGAIRSGYGPIRVHPAQRDVSGEQRDRCGPAYNATFDKGAGENAHFSDGPGGIAMDVLGHTASGGYRIRVSRTSLPALSPAARPAASKAPPADEHTVESLAPPLAPSYGSPLLDCSWALTWAPAAWPV
jgi:M6 family metalloprotease-like protein